MRKIFIFFVAALSLFLLQKMYFCEEQKPMPYLYNPPLGEGNENWEKLIKENNWVEIMKIHTDNENWPEKEKEYFEKYNVDKGILFFKGNLIYPPFEIIYSSRGGYTANGVVVLAPKKNSPDKEKEKAAKKLEFFKKWYYDEALSIGDKLGRCYTNKESVASELITKMYRKKVFLNVREKIKKYFAENKTVFLKLNDKKKLVDEMVYDIFSETYKELEKYRIIKKVELGRNNENTPIIKTFYHNNVLDGEFMSGHYWNNEEDENSFFYGFSDRVESRPKNNEMGPQPVDNLSKDRIVLVNGCSTARLTLDREKILRVEQIYNDPSLLREEKQKLLNNFDLTIEEINCEDK